MLFYLNHKIPLNPIISGSLALADLQDVPNQFISQHTKHFIVQDWWVIPGHFDIKDTKVSNRLPRISQFRFSEH